MEEKKVHIKLRKSKKVWVASAVTIFGAALLGSVVGQQEVKGEVASATEWRATPAEEIGRNLAACDTTIHRGYTIWALARALGFAPQELAPRPDGNYAPDSPVSVMAKAFALDLAKGGALHFQVGYRLTVNRQGAIQAFNREGQTVSTPYFLPKSADGSLAIAPETLAGFEKTTPQGVPTPASGAPVAKPPAKTQATSKASSYSPYPERTVHNPYGHYNQLIRPMESDEETKIRQNQSGRVRPFHTQPTPLLRTRPTAPVKLPTAGQMQPVEPPKPVRSPQPVEEQPPIEPPRTVGEDRSPSAPQPAPIEPPRRPESEQRSQSAPQTPPIEQPKPVQLPPLVQEQPPQSSESEEQPSRPQKICYYFRFEGSSTKNFCMSYPESSVSLTIGELKIAVSGNLGRGTSRIQVEPRQIVLKFGGREPLDSEFLNCQGIDQNDPIIVTVEASEEERQQEDARLAEEERKRAILQELTNVIDRIIQLNKVDYIEVQNNIENEQFERATNILRVINYRLATFMDKLKGAREKLPRTEQEKFNAHDRELEKEDKKFIRFRDKLNEARTDSDQRLAAERKRSIL